jgi:hypothetical protein
MKKTKLWLVFVDLLFIPSPVLALDLHRMLSVSPTLTYIYQYGFFDNSDVKDSSRNAFVTDIEADFVSLDF